MTGALAAFAKAVNWLPLAIIQAILGVVEIGFHNWHGAFVAAVLCLMNLLLWAVLQPGQCLSSAPGIARGNLGPCRLLYGHRGAHEDGEGAHWTHRTPRASA